MHRKKSRFAYIAAHVAAVYFACWAFPSLASTSTLAQISVEYFSEPTTDGKAKLEGSITLPNPYSVAKLTPVIIVGGSYATSDGDVFVSEADPLWNTKFWFKDLGDKLAAKGLAVIRFNNRGMHSSLDCARIAGKSVNAAEYAANSGCYDAAEAGTTTYATQEADIAEVNAMVEKDSRLDASKTIFIVHSEGAFHVSKVLSDHAIRPAGIVFIGAPMDSPAQTTRWQEVERQAEWIGKSIARNGGYFSNDAINQSFRKDLDGDFYSSAPLMSDEGGWTKKNLPKLLVQLNDLAARDVKTIMATQPEAPITSPIGDSSSTATIVLAKNLHWHSTMTDSFRPIDAVKAYDGDLRFVYGEDDVSIPAEHAIELIRNAKMSACSIKIIRPKNADHGLRNADKQLDPKAESAVIAEVVQMSSSDRAHLRKCGGPA